MKLIRKADSNQEEIGELISIIRQLCVYCYFNYKSDCNYHVVKDGKVEVAKKERLNDKDALSLLAGSVEKPTSPTSGTPAPATNGLLFDLGASKPKAKRRKRIDSSSHE